MTTNPLPAVKTFDFAPGLTLRSITINSEPWFIAKDVADALGFADAFSAAQHLDDDERANLPVEGFARGAIVVNESGLYSMILRSRKPDAKRFQKWVTAAVLPALRRGGMYFVGQETVDLASMSYEESRLYIEDLQAKVAEAEAIRWAKSREDRSDYRAAMKFIRQRSVSKAPRARLKARP